MEGGGGEPTWLEYEEYVCNPSCDGKECGPDGCGGSCGECESPETCATGQCVNLTEVGCSDGFREGFVDQVEFPGIASCVGTWIGEDLRAESTSTPCGDDLPDSPECNVPADLCATGWHVCLKDGLVAEVTSKIDAATCNSDIAGDGPFVGASSHCHGGCTYPVPLPCVPFSAQGTCDQPVACGSTETGMGTCKDALWPGQTHWGGYGCSSGSQDNVLGVMCCKDQ